MSVDVKIKGLDEVLAHMENINPRIDRELTSTMNQEGISWRDDVRANTPVDSGVLRGAMTFDGVNKTGSGFEMTLRLKRKNLKRFLSKEVAYGQK